MPVDPEPGEEVFFHGHPSWRSLALFYAKGLLVALVLGVIAGVVTRIANHHVQAGWVAAVVVVACLAPATVLVPAAEAKPAEALKLVVTPKV